VDGQIDHVVATFLIDRESRIAKRYLGLEHEVAELTRDIADLASSPAPGVVSARPPAR
jgi:cytochrome oxidase Cu insertion factor (SCO1/SenC/PrrC family)